MNIRVLIAFLSCIVSIVSIGLGWFNLSLFLSLVSYFLLLFHCFKTTGANSILFLFMGLFGLYGYSVPISVFFEADIGWHRVAKLREWEMVDHTLFSFMLSNQMALLAIAILFMVYVKKRFMRIPQTNLRLSKSSYFSFAIIAGVFSSLSEGLNFMRVGGLSAISNGKAFYQGAVNDLVLNIPYEGFFYISVALFSQFFASLGRTKDKYLFYLPIYLLSVGFVLFVNLSVGERGTLLVAMATFALGYTIRQRITQVRFSFIILFGLIYVAFNFLTLIREPSIEYKGFSDFMETYDTRFYRLLNPANSEFGAPALNYRIFIDKKPKEYNFKLGASYTEISTAFIPTWIYPNKPKGIIYEFRDKYFPERKKMGSTAGTGFSSLMEAYMNFGYFGPLIVYFIFMFLLIYFESKKGGNGMFVNLCYLLLFNVFLIFSRSASKYILFTLILYSVQIVLVVMVYRLLPKKMFSILKAPHAKT